MADTELYPDYLAVAKIIIEGDHSPGTIYTHEWLRSQLRIRTPKPDELITSADHQRLELRYCSQMDGLRNALLTEHHIDIKSVPGKGYEVLSPVDQITHGRDKLESSVRKGMKSSAALLVNVDRSKLDAGAAAMQLNSLAKIGALSVLVRKRKFLAVDVPAALPEKKD